MSDNNGSQDPLVVSTAALSAALSPWVDTHRAEHPNVPPAGPGFVDPDVWDGEQPVFPVGAIPWLSEATGLSDRRIQAILQCETKVTTLRVADQLISAIGRPDLMPEVIPNPRWNQERWFNYMRERGCA